MVPKQYSEPEKRFIVAYQTIEYHQSRGLILLAILIPLFGWYIYLFRHLTDIRSHYTVWSEISHAGLKNRTMVFATLEGMGMIGGNIVLLQIFGPDLVENSELAPLGWFFYVPWLFTTAIWIVKAVAYVIGTHRHATSQGAPHFLHRSPRAHLVSTNIFTPASIKKALSNT